jgi:hypothetical protein
MMIHILMNYFVLLLLLLSSTLLHDWAIFESELERKAELCGKLAAMTQFSMCYNYYYYYYYYKHY